MARCCKLPSGKTVNVDDLPIELFEDLAVANGVRVMEWYGIAAAPGLFPKAAVGLLNACAERAGDPLPPAGYLTPGNVKDVFPEIEDDLPTSYEDGQPKTEGDQTTDG